MVGAEGEKPYFLRLNSQAKGQSIIVYYYGNFRGQTLCLTFFIGGFFLWQKLLLQTNLQQMVLTI